MDGVARLERHKREPEDPDLASEAARGRADAHPDKRGGQFLNFTSTTQYDMRKQAEEEEGAFVNRVNELTERAKAEFATEGFKSSLHTAKYLKPRKHRQIVVALDLQARKHRQLYGEKI